MIDLNMTINYTLPFKYSDNPFVFGISLLSILLCIFGSSIHIFCTKKKLSGLNNIIKSILYLMSGVNLISNLITLVNVILMYFWNLQNLTTCTMNTLSFTISYFNTIISLAVISQVRYYITTKTSQIRTYSKQKLKHIIVAVYILSLGEVIITDYINILYGRSQNLRRLCFGITEVDNNKYRISLFVNGTFSILIIIINLIGDVSMWHFIWKRKHQVSPVQLVPWKSSSEVDSYDMAVPLHATALSMVSLIIVLIALAAIAFLFDIVLYIILLIRLYICVVIPYILLSKIIKTKKPKLQIPKGLQMHEKVNGKEDENEEADENMHPNINEQSRQSRSDQTSSRSNPFGLSNEVILDPKELKFNGNECSEESIELKPIIHKIPIMVKDESDDAY